MIDTHFVCLPDQHTYFIFWCCLFFSGLCTIFMYRNDERHSDTMCGYCFRVRKKGQWKLILLCYSLCLTVCLPECMNIMSKHLALRLDLNFLFLRLLIFVCWLILSIFFFCSCVLLVLQSSFLVSLMSTVYHCAWKTHIWKEITFKIIWATTSSYWCICSHTLFISIVFFSSPRNFTFYVLELSNRVLICF